MYDNLKILNKIFCFCMCFFCIMVYKSFLCVKCALLVRIKGVLMSTSFCDKWNYTSRCVNFTWQQPTCVHGATPERWGRFVAPLWQICSLVSCRWTGLASVWRPSLVRCDIPLKAAWSTDSGATARWCGGGSWSSCFWDHTIRDIASIKKNTLDLHFHLHFWQMVKNKTDTIWLKT